MTYHTDNKVRKFAKRFRTKYGKKFVNKGISASKRLKTAAKNFNQGKYGQT